MSEPELLGAAETWKILGRRWTLAILQTLASADVLRFTELKKTLKGVSGTMLSERLLELENEGLITKKVYGSVPPKVEYRLTGSARELVLIMRQVCTWHARRMPETGKYEILSQPAR
ncbi:MAG: winged helix-turn-helix transcriptional regulator [Nitrososphaera sp.]